MNTVAVRRCQHIRIPLSIGIEGCRRVPTARAVAATKARCRFLNCPLLNRVKGAETATTPEEKAWFEADRRLREKLTIRDIGIWSHYGGDASQSLHGNV